MPRMPRLESPGSLYHIMAHSIEGRDLFVDDQDRNDFLSRFEKGLKKCDFQCYAWSLMDNHYHLLIRSSDLPLSKLMRSLNGGYAQHYNKKYKRKGYLFQDRFKSVLCEDQDYAMELIRYIHLNPLRAGLVKTLEQLKTWAWCGHGYLLGTKNAHGEQFQNREECLRRFGGNETGTKTYNETGTSEMYNETGAIEAYLRFLAQGCTGDMTKAGQLSITEATEIAGSCKGWPAVIGTPDFVKNAMEKYKMNLNRKHRKADYLVVLENLSDKICTDYGFTNDVLLRRGKNNKRSEARAAFCRQAHLEELIPLSVIARYLKMTISPVSVLVNKSLVDRTNSSKIVS